MRILRECQVVDCVKLDKYLTNKDALLESTKARIRVAIGSMPNKHVFGGDSLQYKQETAWCSKLASDARTPPLPILPQCELSSTCGTDRRSDVTPPI